MGSTHVDIERAEWTSGTPFYGPTANYEGTILPQFKANGVSLDDLSVDTDWKSPNTWNGWEWNSSLFPDPTAFTDWAASQHIDVALNVHPAIATNDPLYSQAQDIAGNTLTTSGGSATWDWANVAQAESYFATADPTQNSVGLTWLDWCCDASGVFSQPGVTADSWINYLTAQQMANDGERGYMLGMQQLRNSGELAVPAMVNILTSTTPEDMQMHDVVERALIDLGRQALNPLLAATEMPPQNPALENSI